MPWKATDKMQEKEKFINEVLIGNKPFKHICADFGISEKTGYKWKKRFFEKGKFGLYEESRAPVTRTNMIREDIVIAILTLKQAHPHWGGKKIKVLLEKQYSDTPSLSSINRILDKAGQIKKRKVRIKHNESRRLNQHIKPDDVNDVWAIDFKGWWRSDGEICEPFTVRELVSRKILCVKLMRSKDSDSVKAVMSELFKKYGLPKVIRSDNGAPFCSSNGILSLTRLSAWWITLGIMPDRTDKGTPGQNGSLERMHADIAREIEGKVKGGIAANQTVIDAWVKEYNTVRPNEAIGMKTPDEIFKPSPRKYTGDVEEIEYPIGFLPRKVSSKGTILMKGIPLSISYALAGFTVGLREAEENKYEVFLGDFLLGTIDINSYCFIPLDVV